MRQVYQGNVSIPLHIVNEFIEASKGTDLVAMAEAANLLTASLKEAKKRIDNGLDDSNLSVCIGKFAYVNSYEARRFLSGEIPRICIYRKSKENHDMPLYFKHKPSDYIRRAATKKSREEKKNEGKATDRRPQKAKPARRS